VVRNVDFNFDRKGGEKKRERMGHSQRERESEREEENGVIALFV
jgi:hypothetical protein